MEISNFETNYSRPPCPSGFAFMPDTQVNRVRPTPRRHQTPFHSFHLILFMSFHLILIPHKVLIMSEFAQHRFRCPTQHWPTASQGMSALLLVPIIILSMKQLTLQFSQIIPITVSTPFRLKR